MVANDNACFLTKHVSFKSIASKLAPTVVGGVSMIAPMSRLAAVSLIDPRVDQ
jgi:hypothetical protein